MQLRWLRGRSTAEVRETTESAAMILCKIFEHTIEANTLFCMMRVVFQAYRASCSDLSTGKLTRTKVRKSKDRRQGAGREEKIIRS